MRIAFDWVQIQDSVSPQAVVAVKAPQSGSVAGRYQTLGLRGNQLARVASQGVWSSTDSGTFANRICRPLARASRCRRWKASR